MKPTGTTPLALTLALAIAGCATAPEADGGATSPAAPRTTPEASGWTRTSTSEEVAAFGERLLALPHADRLARHRIGRSHEGRDLVLWVAADPMPASLEDLRGDERLRLFVNGNIHGGEVEGKEAGKAPVVEVPAKQAKTAKG